MELKDAIANSTPEDTTTVIFAKVDPEGLYYMDSMAILGAVGQAAPEGYRHVCTIREAYQFLVDWYGEELDWSLEAIDELVSVCRIDI